MSWHHPTPHPAFFLAPLSSSAAAALPMSRTADQQHFGTIRLAEKRKKPLAFLAAAFTAQQARAAGGRRPFHHGASVILVPYAALIDRWGLDGVEMAEVGTRPNLTPHLIHQKKQRIRLRGLVGGRRRRRAEGGAARSLVLAVTTLVLLLVSATEGFRIPNVPTGGSTARSACKSCRRDGLSHRAGGQFVRCRAIREARKLCCGFVRDSRTTGTTTTTTTGTRLQARKVDHYDVLGLQPGATPEEVKKAYRERAKSTHPDASRTKETIQEFMKVKEVR